MIAVGGRYYISKDIYRKVIRVYDTEVTYHICSEKTTEHYFNVVSKSLFSSTIYNRIILPFNLYYNAI